MANKWEEIYSSTTLDCSQLACIYPGEKPSQLIYLLNEYSLMEEIDWDGFSQVTGQMVFWLKVLSRPVGEQWRKAKLAFVSKYMQNRDNDKDTETSKTLTSNKVDSQPCDSAGTLIEHKLESSSPDVKVICENTTTEHPDSSIKLPDDPEELVSERNTSPEAYESLPTDQQMSFPLLNSSTMKMEMQPKSQASFSCEHCSYSTQYQSRMRSHLRTMHSDSKPFSCTMCDHKTSLYSSLKKHINSVHRKSKPHKCPHCPYTAAMKQYLTIHIRGVHEKNYKHQCPHCDYASVSKNVVRIHINAVHEKTKPHKCPYCDYTSSYPTYIPKHIDAVHKNLRPFACPHCDYKSSTKIYLQKHIDAVHSNIRPYSCPHCPFTTSYQQYLNKHIRAVHLDEKPYKCSFCPFRCAYKSYITKHIQLVHATENGELPPEIPTEQPANNEEETEAKPLIEEFPAELLMNNNIEDKTATDMKQEEAGCSSRTNDCVFPGMDLHNNMFL